MTVATGRVSAAGMASGISATSCPSGCHGNSSIHCNWQALRAGMSASLKRAKSPEMAGGQGVAAVCLSSGRGQLGRRTFPDWNLLCAHAFKRPRLILPKLPGAFLLTLQLSLAASVPCSWLPH